MTSEMDKDALGAAARLAEQSAMKTIAGRIVDLERRLVGLENSNQIGHSSIDGGALVLGDAEGNYRGSLGTQIDGSVTLVELNGDTPPTPTQAIVDVSTVGSATVGWDGLWAAGPVPALDIARVDIYVTTPDVTDPLAAEVPSVGTVLTSRGGAATMSLMPGDYLAYLVTWSRSGKASVPSEAVAFTVAPIAVAPTDGNPPPAVSLVTLNGVVEGIQVRWRPVTNADSTTYDVHAVELPPGVDDFEATDANRVGRGTGDFTVIRALANGEPLAYEQTVTSTHSVSSYTIDGEAGVVTATTPSPHTFQVGDDVAVAGAGNPRVDVNAIVTGVPSPTTITYATAPGANVAATSVFATARRTARVPLRYGFKVIAWDEDGAAAPSACAIGSTKLITHENIAARSISGDQIDARSITADHMESVMVMSGMFTTSDPEDDQPRVEQTAEGIFTYGDKFGPDGRRARSVELVPGRSVFRGRLEADEVVVIDGMQISGRDTGDGGGTKFLPGAEGVLAATVPAPQNPVTVKQSAPQSPLPPPPAGFNAAHRQGPLYADVADGNGVCLWTAIYSAATGELLLEQFTADGAERIAWGPISLYGDTRFDPTTMTFGFRRTTDQMYDLFVLLYRTGSSTPTLFRIYHGGPGHSDELPDGFVELPELSMSTRTGAVGKGAGTGLAFAMPVDSTRTVDGQTFAAGEVAIRLATVEATRMTRNLATSANGSGDMSGWTSPYGIPRGVEDAAGFFGRMIEAPRNTDEAKAVGNHAPYANSRGATTGWATTGGNLTAQPISAWSGSGGAPSSTHFYNVTGGSAPVAVYQAADAQTVVTPGAVMSWSVLVRGLTSVARLRTRWFNASGNVVRTDVTAPLALTPASQTLKMENLEAPTGAVRMEVGITRDADPLSASLGFGNVRIVRGEAMPADGFRDGYSFGWRFLDRPGESVSGPTDEVTEVATAPLPIDLEDGEWLGVTVGTIKTNGTFHAEVVVEWFDGTDTKISTSTVWSTRENNSTPIVGIKVPVATVSAQAPAGTTTARVRLLTYLAGSAPSTHSLVRWSGILIGQHESQAEALAQSFGKVTVTPTRTLRVPHALGDPIAAVEVNAGRFDYPAASTSAVMLTRRAPVSTGAFGVHALVFEIPTGTAHARIEAIGDGWAWYSPGTDVTAYGWNPVSGRIHALRSDGRALVTLSHNMQIGELSFGYAWADNKASGGTHVTTVSPRRIVNIFARLFTRVTLAPLPSFPANANHLDDPDSAYVYVGRSSLRERMQRQGTGPAPGTPGENVIVDLDAITIPPGTANAPAALQPSATNTFRTSTLFAPASWRSEVQPADDGYAPGVASGFKVDGFGGGYWLHVMPIGTILEWAGTAPPPGWAFADGSTMNRADFPILFGAIGTKYGAPSSTTFKLPMRVGTERTETTATALSGFNAAATVRIEDGYAQLTGTCQRTAGATGAQNAISVPSRFTPSAQAVFPVFAAGGSAGSDTSVQYAAMQPTGVLVVNYATASTGAVWLTPLRWKVAAWTLCDDTNWIIRVA